MSLQNFYIKNTAILHSKLLLIAQTLTRVYNCKKAFFLMHTIHPVQGATATKILPLKLGINF